METWSFYSAGIRIAREAVDASGREAYVAADIGPIGALLKPLGTMDFDEAYDLFAHQAVPVFARGIF